MMKKYGPFELTEDKYNKQVFCNGKPGSPSIYHNWHPNAPGTETETCQKCGRVRFLTMKTSNPD